jgi:hypothetical protein
MFACILTDAQAAKRRKTELKETLLAVPFVLQVPLDGKEDFVDVKKKKIAGFSVDECRLYVRRETVDLWSALEQTFLDGWNLSVDGPPGTGKSTEVWAWALWKAVTLKKTITWFHLTNKRTVMVEINGAKQVITYGFRKTVHDIAMSAGDILVVDGVTKKLNRDVNEACNNWQAGSSESARRFVTVSSASVSTSTHISDEAHTSTFTVASWTLAQYTAAIGDDDLHASVESNLVCDDVASSSSASSSSPSMSKLERLENKFRFAGGSARWMFESSYAKWKTDIDVHFRHVSKYSDVYLEAGGDEAGMAVNHLRGVSIVKKGDIHDKKYFFISQYVAMTLGNKCNDKRKFLVDSYKKARETENPSFLGWIFEFDVDYQLEACSTSTMHQLSVPIRPDNSSETWRVDKYVTFSTVSELVAEIKGLDGTAWLWAKPVKWNQAAYDFLCFRKVDGKLHMKAVNATAGKTHSVLLSVINVLGQQLGLDSGSVVESITFDFIVPTHSVFKRGNIVGNLAGWKNLKQVPWPTNSSGNFDDYVFVAELEKTTRLN